MELTGERAPDTAPVVVDGTAGSVVRVTLRGTSRNQLDLAALDALLTALDAAEVGGEARAIVLAAEGTTFCAGLALGDLGTADWRPRIAAVETLFHRLATSPLLTVAVVDGAAVGGGVGLAAACDHVIAGPRARFRLTEVLLGLFPAMVLPVLTRRVGPHRAYHLALTATEIDGVEAHRLGLADRMTLEPERALRHALVGLRRSDPAAVAALKRYYTAHLTAGARQWEPAAAVLAPRFADPGLHRRLDGFRAQGLIP